MTAPHRVEMPGSPQIRISSDGLSATREFLTEWSDWEELVEELLGGYRGVGSIEIPQRPLKFPGFELMWVSDISVQPWHGEAPDGTQGSVADFESTSYMNTYASGALVRAEYKSRDSMSGGGGAFPDQNIDLPEGQTITYEESLGVERVTLPNRGFQWDSDGAKADLDLNASIEVPVARIAMTWDFLSELPHAPVRSVIGKVNASTFPPNASNGFTAETLLFSGVSTSRRFQFNQRWTGFWSLRFEFQYRSVWDIRAPGFARLENDNGTKIYTTADFTTLFPGVTWAASS